MTTFTDKCLDIADRLTKFWGVRHVDWTQGHRDPRAFFDTRTIRAPFPRTEGDFAIFLHEIGHFAFRREGDRWPDWKLEARCSTWAQEAYETYLLPDPDAAAFRLGRYLHPHLEDAVRRGIATSEEIRSEVRGTLLPYSERLGLDNGHVPRVDEEEIRSYLAGPAFWQWKPTSNARPASTPALRRHRQYGRGWPKLGSC
jgi:hypothetical protein